MYVAAERVAVVKRRLAAFRKHHDLDDIPLAVVGGPADLRTGTAHANLIAEYAARLSELAGLPTVLIIIETINRVLAGGDENSSKDMGRLLCILTDIQERTSAHILTVHLNGWALAVEKVWTDASDEIHTRYRSDGGDRYRTPRRLGKMTSRS